MIYQLSALWLLLSAAVLAERYDDYSEYSDFGNRALNMLQDYNTAAAPYGHSNMDVSGYEGRLLIHLIKGLVRKELNEEMHRPLHQVYPVHYARPQYRLMTNRTRYKICYFKLC